MYNRTRLMVLHNTKFWFRITNNLHVPASRYFNLDVTHVMFFFFWNQREILCTLKRVQKLFCVSKSLNSEPVMHLRGFPELGGAYTMDGVTNWLQLLRQSLFSIASNADAILCIRNDKLAWCSQSSHHMCCSGRLLQRWLQLALCLLRQPSLQGM
jgi:hypothetical protein